MECVAFHAGEASASVRHAFEPRSAADARDVAARFTERATLCLINAAVFAHSNPGGHVEQAERISHCLDACLDAATASNAGARRADEANGEGAATFSAAAAAAASPPSSAASAATGAAPLHVCTVDVPVPSPSAARAARSSYAAPLQGLDRLGSITLQQLQFTLSFVHSARYLRSLCVRAARSAELGALVALNTHPALLGASFDAIGAAGAAQQSSDAPAAVRGAAAQAAEDAAAVREAAATAEAAPASSAVPLASSALASFDCQCKQRCGKYDPRAKNISVRQLKSGQTMYEVTGPCSNYKPKKPKAIAKRKRENNRQPLGRFPCLAEAIAWSTVRPVPPHLRTPPPPAPALSLSLSLRPTFHTTRRTLLDDKSQLSFVRAIQRRDIEVLRALFSAAAFRRRRGRRARHTRASPCPLLRLLFLRCLCLRLLLSPPPLSPRRTRADRARSVERPPRNTGPHGRADEASRRATQDCAAQVLRGAAQRREQQHRRRGERRGVHGGQRPSVARVCRP